MKRNFSKSKKKEIKKKRYFVIVSWGYSGLILVFLYRKEGPRKIEQHSENKKKGYFVILLWGYFFV